MRDRGTPDRPDHPEPAETPSEAPTVGDFESQPPGNPPGGALTPGQQFGSFEVVRLLGTGGMGEVYEAYDTRTERHVALKILADRLASDRSRKRFLREGRLAARVSHRNSVFVFGTEEIDGTQVIAMELMPGGSVEDLFARAAAPVKSAVDASAR